MAQSEQARLVKDLQGKGYSIKDIAALTGRTPRYIEHARDSVEKTGKGGKIFYGKGQNLIPFLKELNEKGKVSPASIPGRRTTKGGSEAKVRTSPKPFQSAVGEGRYQSKGGAKTIDKMLSEATSKKNLKVRFAVHFGKIKTISPGPGKPGWVASPIKGGALKPQEVIDRITANGGDTLGTIRDILREQNSSWLVTATGATEYRIMVQYEK